MIFKPVLHLLLIVCTLQATAQKVSIWQGNREITNSRQNVRLAVGEEVQHTLTFENNTNEELTISIKRSASETKSIKRSDIYWKANSHKQAKRTLLPKGSEDAAIHFQAGTTTATEKVLYTVVFSDKAGTQDSVHTQFHYQVQEPTRASYEKLKMSLYPNPVQTELAIDIKEMPGTCDVVIYNNIGQQVRKIHLSNTREITRISVSEFNSGLYFASVVKDDEILLTKRFLVNH
jgi:hypothetical protein